MQKILKTALVGALSTIVVFGASAKNDDNASLNEQLKNMNVEESVVTPDSNAQVAEEKSIEAKATEKTETAENTEKLAEEKTEQEIKEVKDQEVIKPVEKEPETPIKPEAKFPHGLQLGVGVSGTTGLNGWIGYNNKKFDSFWWKRIGVRVDFATMSPFKSLIKKATDYATGEEGLEFEDFEIKEIELKSHHIAALVDIYPFGDTWFLGGLRVSGGYFFGKTELSASLTGTIDGLPSDGISFELGNEKYQYIGNGVAGKAKAIWDFKGPYAGAGFDLGISSGFKIFFDAGVVFTSKSAEFDLDINKDNLQHWNGSAWEAVNNPTLETQYENAKKEALKEVQDELDKINFYPIVKLGFMYRF